MAVLSLLLTVAHMRIVHAAASASVPKSWRRRLCRNLRTHGEDPDMLTIKAATVDDITPA